MRYLSLIKIKNKDFDFAKYGLKSNYFTIDISQSVNYSRGVGFTQYAVLDGTTRIDNISKEPSSITLQGKLGEVRAGGTHENYVQATISKTRLQNQMDLLEALRDQAIFLDIITDERSYRDHLIQSLSYGKNKFDEIDVSLTIKEVITFGDEIDVQATEQNRPVSLYEQTLLLDRFEMRPINNDSDLVGETNRMILNSVLSSPFIITLGSVDINADIIFPAVNYVKRTSRFVFPNNVNVKTVDDTNEVLNNVIAGELISGPVIEGNYLLVSTPVVRKGTNLYRTQLVKQATGKVDEYPVAKTYINIKIMNGKNTVYSVNQGSVLMEPKYSNISNGIHPLDYSGSNGDLISSARFGINFIRKLKYNRYTLAPNLLGLDSRGYLYNASYEIKVGSNSRLQPTLVYIHPLAWKRIKEELKRTWSESTYFRDKELNI